MLLARVFGSRIILFVYIIGACLGKTPLSACIQACEAIAIASPRSVYLGSAASLDLWSLFQAEVIPQCRVQPSSVAEVAQVLDIARSHQCHFAVMAGGTSPFRHASNAAGGITIDLRQMNLVRLVDPEQLHVEAFAGAVWADVYRALDPLDLSAVGTRNSLTGVTGSILGGGISFFSQRYGWSCDNVVEFEVVLANSSIVTATQTDHPEVFFALRGGGNNFGIVTRVVIEAFRDPPTWYTFQLWDLGLLGTVFQRLEKDTTNMPSGVWQLAVTLGWLPSKQDFFISERMVATEVPDLPESLPFPGSELSGQNSSAVLETYIYQRSILAMSQKMDTMNPSGFYNYFGSVTVKNHASIFLALGEIFCQEVYKISKTIGLQVYIVYNPLTVETIRQMQKKGGNALGINVDDGPLTIVNINLHWSEKSDTDRMTNFMRRVIHQFQQASANMGMAHPYLFQNHAFFEQDVFAGYSATSLQRLKEIQKEVDPEGVFRKLQPGYFKLEGWEGDGGKQLKSEL